MIFAMIIALGVSPMVIGFDMKDVQEWEVDGIPTILRSTSSYGDIIALVVSSRGGTSLAGKAGALDLLASALAKGTPSYSKEDIDRILNETGAVLSIDARSDAVDVSLKALKKYLPQIMPMLSEMMRVPLLRSEEIELVRGQMMSMLKSEQETPDGMMGLMLHQAFYKNHPYLQRSRGFLETIPTITRDELVALTPIVFNRSNILVTWVGNLTKEEATGWVKSHFAVLPEGPKASTPSNPLSPDNSKVHFQEFKSPTTYFMARFKAPALKDEDYPAMAIATQILDARLFEEVRTKRGLTYAVSASLSNNAVNGGSLYVSSTNIPEAVQVIFAEIEKMKTELVPADDLRNQSRKFSSNWWLSREQSSSQARIFSMYEILDLGWEASQGLMERLNKVTAEDVRRVSQKYFTNYTVGLVGPQNVDLKAILPK
jgi:zinc protease